MVKTQDDRLFYVSEAIRRGIPIEEIADLTKIDIFFLDKLLHIVEIEDQLKVNIFEPELLKTAKKMDFLTVRLPNYGTLVQKK